MRGKIGACSCLLKCRVQASIKVHWCRDGATLAQEEYRSFHVMIQHAIVLACKLLVTGCYST